MSLAALIGVWVRGYLSDNGHLPGSYATKEKPSSNLWLIYILREELGLLWLLCCLLIEEPLVCSPKPVLIFVRGSLGATSCESPPGDNHSCYYIIPGRQSSKRLTLPLKSTELDVAEHRGSSRYSGGWDRMTMSSKPAWPMQKDPSWRRQII